jgi:hypothetical protein
MANTYELMSWLSNNLDTINFKSTNLNWVKNFNLPYNDIHSEFKFGDKNYIGRGSDSSLDLAILKSFSECVERFGLTIFDIQTSNGVACHPELVNAKKNAFDELIERHLFLCHFHSSIPFKKIKIDTFLNLEALNTKLISKKIDLNFFTLLESQDVYSVLCVANGLKRENPWGLTFGMGTDCTMKLAIEKALIENMRKVSYYLSSNDLIEKISLSDFNRLADYTFRDHGKLALDVNYAESISYLFEENGFKKNRLQLKSVDYTFYDLNQIKVFKEIPLSLVRCTSKEVQPLYVGPSETHLNLDILQLFCEDISIDFRLNLLPHPLD